MLFDEAVSALDAITRNAVLEVIRSLKNEKGVAGIFVSHDLAVLSAICDRIFIMQGGEFVDHGSVESIFKNSDDSHPLTKKLIEAIPGYKRMREKGEAGAVS